MSREEYRDLRRTAVRAFFFAHKKQRLRELEDYL
jgi:hypothetical protein